MISQVKTVEEYLAGLPEDRRNAISRVRETILAYLPEGYEEGIQYGMIGYYVPFSIHPAGYHCDPKQPMPFAGLASQKNYMVLHLMCAYMDGPVKEQFVADYKASGKKLDMGAACVRFKKLEDLPLDVIGRTIAKVPVQKWIDICTEVVRTRKKK